MDKDLIRKRFARSFAHYGDSPFVQTQMAQHLERMLMPELRKAPCPNVLELGCGSTPLAAALTRHITVQRLTLNDLVDVRGIVSEAMRALPIEEFKFIEGDMEKVDLPGNQDLIVANAAFQWLAEPSEFMARAIGLLEPGGILAFSTFGPENLREIRDLTGLSLRYSGTAHFKAALAGSGEVVSIEEQLCSVPFDTPRDVLRHLKATGVNALARRMWTRKDLREFEEAYRSKFDRDGKVELTYHPVYVIFRKPAGDEQ